MSNKNKILVVDDEPRNQRIIIETLEDVAEMIVANSGEEALQLMENFSPDLVLLDIMMPGIDGYEVCRQIRSQPKYYLTKIILISGKAMIEERLQGYACGADDYMTKPFVPEELFAKTKVYLRLAQAENEIVSLNSKLEGKIQEKTLQLMTAEEKLFSSASEIDITVPLNSIRVLARHIETLIANPVIERSLIFEKIKGILKTADRIQTLLRVDAEETFDSSINPLKKVD